MTREPKRLGGEQDPDRRRPGAFDKAAARDACWTALQLAGAARFPGPRGRIPNFKGAEAAADRLVATEAFAKARAIKCNPDSPQRPIRHAALRAGKIVYMAVPKLADSRPFLELDPTALPTESLWEASSIRGAERLGRPVALEDMPPIDLVVTGCVAVTREGARLGKGGGFSDLEYALLREAGKLTDESPIATTVHPSQILPDGKVPMTPHDISLDLIATPEELIVCRGRFPRPRAVLWEEIDPLKRDSIPVLRDRRKR